MTTFSTFPNFPHSSVTCITNAEATFRANASRRRGIKGHSTVELLSCHSGLAEGVRQCHSSPTGVLYMTAIAVHSDGATVQRTWTQQGSEVCREALPRSAARCLPPLGPPCCSEVCTARGQLAPEGHTAQDTQTRCCSEAHTTWRQLASEEHTMQDRHNKGKHDHLSAECVHPTLDIQVRRTP